MGLKQMFQTMKEDAQKKKELKKLQKEAYFEQMEVEAKEMGKKQAQMESKHREKLYGKKLEVVEEKRTARITQGPVDVFGFNRDQGNKQTKQFDIMSGKYK